MHTFVIINIIIIIIIIIVIKATRLQIGRPGKGSARRALRRGGVEAH